MERTNSGRSRAAAWSTKPSVPPKSAIEMIRQLGPDVDYRELDAAHNVMLSQPEALVLNDLAAATRTSAPRELRMDLRD